MHGLCVSGVVFYQLRYEDPHISSRPELQSITNESRKKIAEFILTRELRLGLLWS